MDEVASQSVTATAKQFAKRWQAIVDQVGRTVVGQSDEIAQVLTCLLAGGHALLEGVPGLGKTLLVRTLAGAMDLSYQRIQFTPDLMPGDITGTEILDQADGSKSFRFEPGPIFANFVLADEINRATPKTQSAVLEAMQEGTVSVGRTSHPLPRPMVVLATQNPIDMEGTYPLPEAQVDRFLLKVRLDAPNVDELVCILDRTTGVDEPRPEPVIDAAGIEQLKDAVRAVPVGRDQMHLAARLVSATHPGGAEAPDDVRRYVRLGASPRGAQAIVLAAKVHALRSGRAHVATDDLAAVARPALRHRLILNFEGQADGVEPESLIASAARAVGMVGEV